MMPWLALLIALLPQDNGSRLVEPDQLTKNPDLVGRDLTVDDRIRFFQSHKGPGGKQIYDELVLKRTDVVFKLPPPLRPEHPPREPVVRVRGILRQEGRQYLFDVESYELLPSDKERLDKELRRLAPRDLDGMRRWAAWADRRATAFNDSALRDRVTLLETEILLAEAEKPGADLITLAKLARAKRLGEPLAGALAEKGFRARLDAAKSVDELSHLADEVDAFFPNAADPKVLTADGVKEWQERIRTKPIDGYRDAPAPVRAALERILFADITQQRLQRRAGEEPGKTMALAEEARRILPDRPEVSNQLRDRALSASESGVSSMRLSEVEALAKTFRDDGQADRARKLIQTWLDDQRSRKLSPSDADGRVLLASHYDRLLGDRATCVALLREAVRIDPNSREATDTFRRLGFKKSAEGTWVDSRGGDSTSAPGGPPRAPETAPTPAALAGEESLRGLSPSQVLARFGTKPDRKAISATQNDTIEQWIYVRPKGRQIINFKRIRGQDRAVVISSFSLPN